MRHVTTSEFPTSNKAVMPSHHKWFDDGHGVDHFVVERKCQ
jgi:hypothetical protein